MCRDLTLCDRTTAPAAARLGRRAHGRDDRTPEVMTIGLSEYERTVLRRLAADLHRQDPDLGRRLTGFPASSEHAGVSWRPPKAAVVVAAVLLAGAGFLVTALTAVMRQSCTDAATGAGVTAAAPPQPRASTGPRPTSPPRESTARPAVSAAASPAPC